MLTKVSQVALDDNNDILLSAFPLTRMGKEHLL